MRLYNSISGSKEVFSTIEPGRVRMYVCGPTVYDFLHIGNFRGAVTFNLLRNWLEKSGYTVNYVYNFTDIDDKILNKARAENVPWESIPTKFIEEFWKDYNALELKPHSSNPKVSEHLQDIIGIIERLIQNRSAYQVDGEVFFSVKSFEPYGKLSGRTTSDQQAGARVEIDPRKHDPLDFTLWKPSAAGEPGFPSPWGMGRPGWHIECSAMNHSLLGEQIDIHGGGIDLLFPHHENEIAQSEAAFKKTFARYWVHNNMITFDGQKMSKSLGNVRTMRSFLESFEPEVFKFMVLNTHYRSVLDFSDACMNNAVSGLSRIYSALALSEELRGDFAAAPKNPVLAQFSSRISDALNEDLNSAEAISVIFEAVRWLNGKAKRGQKPSTDVRKLCADFSDWLLNWGETFSLFRQPPAEFLVRLTDQQLRERGLTRSEIQLQVSQREQARRDKNFAQSDEIRDTLVGLSIALQDRPDGTTYWEFANEDSKSGKSGGV